VGGAGAEPAGIRRFKAYAVFFEQDGFDVADVNLRVYDRDCGSGKVFLTGDTSRDYKSMASLGTSARGKALCVQLLASHIPAGETRLVQLVVYYTSDGRMR
jgi:hypothetical protein